MRRFLFLAIAAALLFLVAYPAAGQPSALAVYYAGPETGSVKTALGLAEDFTLVTDPAQAQVFMLDGAVPNPSSIAERVRAGAGLFLILGPDITTAQLATLLGEPVRLTRQDGAVSLKVDEKSNEGLVRDIVWQSAPQVRERLRLDGSRLTPLITAYETGETLLAAGKVGKGSVYLFNPFLSGANPQIREWAYFNYMIYDIAARAGGRTPQRFGDYPASPVPHARDRAILYAAMSLLLVITGGIFLLVRRYSLAHPEALNSLVANRVEFETREAGTAWEKVGFHRPIGGFLFALMSGMILFIPMIIYQNLVLPVYILPSAQAMGIWGRVAAFFPLVWSLFDMGTSVAHIKYFSEHRVHDPARAVQYAQFFVWWQTLSGAVQVAGVTALAGIFLPNTIYAMYIWAIIAHTIIQIPGFFMIMSDNLTALQRSDYNQIVDVASNLIIPMVTQPILITLLVLWGKSHPMFGGAMGGVLGLGFAAYASQLVSFLFGLWLYRRIGYNARLLFMAHFDLKIALESFKYGIFLVVSGLIGGLGSSLQVLIIQSRLINSNEILGNLGMAGNFSFAYTVLLTLTGNAMPAISEAFSNGRKVLSQYYSAMAYKYGAFISAFLAAILLAVADRFIIGSSGKEFERAALYAGPLIISGALQFASWVGDIIQYAANKTRLVTLFAVIGFVVNFGVAYLLVDHWQVYALIATGYIGLIVKDILVYILNDRYCFKQRFYFWQTLAAPVLAGAAHYLWLRWLTGLIWQRDEVTSMIIFLIALLPSYPVYSFLYGLFGGWDDATLAEFGQGAELSSFMRPLVRLFHRASVLGARISPLHNRFPITIRAEAMAEAEALTRERVSLYQPTVSGEYGPVPSTPTV